MPIRKEPRDLLQPAVIAVSDQAEYRDQAFRAEFAESDHRRRVGDDQPGVLQPDQGDQQADAHPDAALQVQGDGVHHPFADMGQDQDGE